MNLLDQYLAHELEELRKGWKAQKEHLKTHNSKFNQDILFMIEVQGKEVRNLINFYNTKQAKGVILYQMEQKKAHAHEKAFNVLEETALQTVYEGIIQFVEKYVKL